MTDSQHVDRFVTTHRGSAYKPRAEAAILCDVVMARNLFFNINYIICTINGCRTNTFKRRSLRCLLRISVKKLNQFLTVCKGHHNIG
jgi:hypothetical protein